MYDTISFVLCTLLLGHVFNALYMYTAALGHVFSYLRVLVYYFQAQYIAFILNYCLAFEPQLPLTLFPTTNKTL